MTASALRWLGERFAEIGRGIGPGCDWLVMHLELVWLVAALVVLAVVVL